MSVNNNNKDLYHSIDAHTTKEQIKGGVRSYGIEPSNKTLQIQMRELKRTKGKFCKNGCGMRIYLQRDQSGKWRPFNENNNESHRCSKKPSKYKCFKCGNSIVFDQDKISNSGKNIPLNETDLSPHQCPNAP